MLNELVRVKNLYRDSPIQGVPIKGSSWRGQRRQARNRIYRFFAPVSRRNRHLVAPTFQMLSAFAAGLGSYASVTRLDIGKLFRGSCDLLPQGGLR